MHSVAPQHDMFGRVNIIPHVQRNSGSFALLSSPLNLPFSLRPHKSTNEADPSGHRREKFPVPKSREG